MYLPMMSNYVSACVANMVPTLLRHNFCRNIIYYIVCTRYPTSNSCGDQRRKITEGDLVVVSDERYLCNYYLLILIYYYSIFYKNNK